MDTTTRSITPLRQRMIEDMRMCKLAEHTQEAYVRAVRRLAAFLKRSPDAASAEDLRNFQLHLADTGTSPITLNATITGLKFERGVRKPLSFTPAQGRRGGGEGRTEVFFDVTLSRPELMAKMRPVRVPRTLPVVLSREEAARLIGCTYNPKHQAALSLAYGTGLRASEIVSLKVSDVDSQRMVLRVEQGKGHKDRYAMLSPVLLERLRQWWRHGRAQGKILPGGWLFPGMDPMAPLTTRQLNRVVHAAAETAKIGKRVTTHTLRHYSESRNMPRRGAGAREKAGRLLGICSPATLGGVTGDDRDSDFRGPAASGAQGPVLGIGATLFRADAGPGLRAGIVEDCDTLDAGLRDLARPARDRWLERRAKARW